VLHDQRVGLRDVDARLDDGGAHEHVRATLHVVHHHRLQGAFAHLTVSHDEANTRAQRTQALGGLLDRFDPVVHEERLSLALVLAQDRALDELLLVLAHICLDGPAPLWGRLDHGDLAQPGE
jgi:hypothetical protein